jgi:hypothetical protein
MALQDELSKSASDFSASLQKLAVALDAEMSKVVRNSVLRAFGAIIKRSPVDTGAYRASHGIANAEPSQTEGIVKGKKGSKLPPATAKSWTWRVGDGNIWLYNNVPYAERIETGNWSKQAPQGVYKMAIPEITNYLNQELAKAKGLAPYGGGGEK